MFDAGTGQPDVIHSAGSHQGIGTELSNNFSLPVDHQLFALRVKPNGGFESYQLVLGKMVRCPLPYFGGLHDVGVTVEGGVVLAHGIESLNR